MTDQDSARLPHTDSALMSVRDVILPGVTADYRKTPFPAHIPVRPGGLCSTMCDHPGIVREVSHQAAVDSWRREMDRAETDNPLAFAPEPGQALMVDMWEINQRELERRVAAGEPLPDGVTVDQVNAWRAERGPGETASLTGPARGKGQEA